MSVMHRLYMDRAARLSGQLAGHERRVQDDWVVIIDDEYHPVQVRPFQAKGEHHVEYRGSAMCIQTDWCFCQPLFRGTVNGETFCFQVKRRGLRYAVTHGGRKTNGMVMTQRAAETVPHHAEKEAGGHVRLSAGPHARAPGQAGRGVRGRRSSTGRNWR